MEQTIVLTLSLQEVEIIMRGLMELQGKVMFSVVQKIDTQVKDQLHPPAGTIER